MVDAVIYYNNWLSMEQHACCFSELEQHSIEELEEVYISSCNHDFGY